MVRAPNGENPAVDQVTELPRSIPLEGTSNLRDLGGWPAAGGRRVRFGQVFRSAGLGGLTEADLSALRRLGIRTVADLRGERERARDPSRVEALDEVAVHALTIEPALGASLRAVAEHHEPTRTDAMRLMRETYAGFALEWSHRYAALFALLAEDERRPLLFHCAAGKDRTGFAAALLLATLGVPADAIRKDYLVTNLLWRGDDEFRSELSEEVADVLMRAHGEMLDAAFEAIRAECGSLEAYLEQRIGVDAAGRERLRAALLE
jgi:protein-tyrosine phosphatase